MNKEEIYHYKSIIQLSKESCMEFVNKVLTVETKEQDAHIPNGLNEQNMEEQALHDNVNGMMYWGEMFKIRKEDYAREMRKLRGYKR